MVGLQSMKMWAKINLPPTAVYQVLPHSFYWFSTPLPQSIGSSIVKLQGSVGNAIICFLLWQVSSCFSIMLHSTMREAHNYLPEIGNQKITDWLPNQDHNSPNSKLYSIELLLIYLSSCLLIFPSMCMTYCVCVYVYLCVWCVWVQVSTNRCVSGSEGSSGDQSFPPTMPSEVGLAQQALLPSEPVLITLSLFLFFFFVANNSEEMNSLVRNLF